MEPGQIVEFIEVKNFIAGLVTRVKASKLLVLTETNREMSVASSRILHQTNPGLDLSRPRAELVQSLKEISSRRASRAMEINLLELWELLDGEGEEFDYRYLAELALPDDTGPDRVPAMLRAIFADGLHFKMRPNTVLRQNAEKVEQITLARIQEEKRGRELMEGASWLTKIWADETPDYPDCRDHVIQTLRDMAIYGSDASEYKWGQKLLEKAGLGKDPYKPFYLLVKMGEIHKHENLDLYRNQIETTFPAAVLSEAENLLRQSDWHEENRRDLTSLETLTIDSSGSGDFDDAISLEEKNGCVILGIHIADVSALVRPDSPLDIEARGLGTTIYMPDQRISMLPEILSEEALSLKQACVRPAFSVTAQIDEFGNVQTYEFFPSLIKVKRQLSYQDVDSTVNSDPTLKKLFAISQTLKSQRHAQGALIMPLPTLNVYLVADGQIGISLINWDNPGRAMISEFMILANYLAASVLAEANIPGLFRYQDEPSQRLLKGEPSEFNLYDCLQQRRYFNRVGWGLDPRPHSGMGLEVYTNLTSPLRRFIDLVMQRQVKSIAAGNEPEYSREQIEELLTFVEPALRKAYDVQSRRKRYWLLRYLEAQSPKNYEAILLQPQPNRPRLFIKELMLETDIAVNSTERFSPGQEVMIKVKRVNAREDILKFELV
ncbi:MAG: RNB domain-containing ribonuclease [Deltaproteobacteria bacterium]|nr:RNB domain-containing ribonuclease [Deltaproteobacteria bacterium]